MKKESLGQFSDDELLIRHKQSPDPDILAELFNRYYHLVYGVCLKYLKNKEEASDAAMQIFSKLLEDLHKYEIQFFRAWLYRVAQNHCLMLFRSRKGYTTSFEEWHEPGMEMQEGLHPALAKEKKLTEMEAALDELNAEQRQCIELFYLQDKSYEEIMALTGYTYMQVKSYIQNGKRNLKIKMSSNV